jgi:hypothetical protein
VQAPATKAGSLRSQRLVEKEWRHEEIARMREAQLAGEIAPFQIGALRPR